MTDYAAIDRYIDDHLNESLDELARLCAVPSVSAQGTGIRECAELVAEMLRQRGFQAEVMPTGGAPVVYAERAASDKTLLFYNHYDVQPPEPLELWDIAAVRADHARRQAVSRAASATTRATLVSRLFAIDALLAVHRRAALHGQVHHRGRGRDQQRVICQISSAPTRRSWPPTPASGSSAASTTASVPMQYLGMRGICYVELRVETANHGRPLRAWAARSSPTRPGGWCGR